MAEQQRKTLTESFFSLFGYQLQPIGAENANNASISIGQATVSSNARTFAIPPNDDGAVVIQSGAYYGTFVDLEGIVRDEVRLCTKYREMARAPEVESAIDDIVDEAIVHDESGKCVDLITDDLNVGEPLKEQIRDEFENVLTLLNFSNMGEELFRRWYVDGRIFFHAIIDEKNPTLGIQELRYIDPRRIRKVREVQKAKDPKTGAEIIRATNEYYVYNERGVIGAYSNLGLRISPDSIISVTSGIMDSRRAIVLSHLDKAIKPMNQLRMTEDAIVIYRLSRAPERRIFYVDVGSLPKAKAEAYLKDLMTKYRNKLVYDADTGEIRNDRKYMAMLEDFWLPRREGSKGTEISTLPAGQNLGELADVQYFEKKLYDALKVPYSRRQQQANGGGGGPFMLGRTTEITRDELKFNKFIRRLRNRFSQIFDDALRLQLSLKGIASVSDWPKIREKIYYDFLQDNNFTEIKEADLLTIRVQTLGLVDPYVGKYWSMEWVRKNVLKQDEDEILELDAQIEKEKPKMQEFAATMNPGGMVDPNNPGGLPDQGGPPQPFQDSDSQPQDPNQTQDPDASAEAHGRTGNDREGNTLNKPTTGRPQQSKGNPDKKKNPFKGKAG
jgi:hypothetical protein